MGGGGVPPWFLQVGVAMDETMIGSSTEPVHLELSSSSRRAPGAFGASGGLLVDVSPPVVVYGASCEGQGALRMLDDASIRGAHSFVCALGAPLRGTRTACGFARQGRGFFLVGQVYRGDRLVGVTLVAGCAVWQLRWPRLGVEGGIDCPWRGESPPRLQRVFLPHCVDRCVALSASIGRLRVGSGRASSADRRRGRRSDARTLKLTRPRRRRRKMFRCATPFVLPEGRGSIGRLLARPNPRSPRIERGREASQQRTHCRPRRLRNVSM